MTTREKKVLANKIANLCPVEHVEIFKIIKDGCDVSFTRNNNGIFINLKNIPDVVLDEITKFVEFCFENKANLDEYDHKVNQVKIKSKVNTVQEVVSSTTLQSALDNSKIDNQWMTAYRDCKEKAKLELITDILEGNMACANKKKSCNMKFSNAKKKFARKVIQDKKNDHTLVSCLSMEI
jgi:hypothetical protein